MPRGIYERNIEQGKKHSLLLKDKYRRGEIKSWNKGLTKETDERIRKNGESVSKARKGKHYPKLSKIRKKLFKEGILKIWNKGKKGLQSHTEKWKEENSQRNIELWKDPLSAFHSVNRSILISKKVSKARKLRKERDGFLLGKNTRKKLKEKGLLNWENEKYREKQIEAILKGLLKRPTSFEQKICDLCIKYNLPFIYSGNGKFLVGYKNPDFKHKYLPILIEVYNDYHHPKDYEEVRGKHFKKYGHKTIFINEKEITDENWENICLNKIMIEFKKEDFEKW